MRHTYTYIHASTYVQTHIYMYTYIYTGSEGVGEEEMLVGGSRNVSVKMNALSKAGMYVSV